MSYGRFRNSRIMPVKLRSWLQEYYMIHWPVRLGGTSTGRKLKCRSDCLRIISLITAKSYSEAFFSVHANVAVLRSSMREAGPTSVTG